MAGCNVPVNTMRARVRVKVYSNDPTIKLLVTGDKKFIGHHALVPQ